LDLPPALSGFISIPDSVECLSFSQGSRRLLDQVLLFGSESKLQTFQASPGMGVLAVNHLYTFHLGV
jgi:hypothetical protein